MRAIIQRVSEARVVIGGEVAGDIGRGFLVLLGVEDTDGTEDLDWLLGKIIRMRVFEDDAGQMNLSLEDVNASLLIVSQFTLHASTKKGNRPSFIRAAKPNYAIPLYEAFVSKATDQLGRDRVQTGKFGADMKVTLTNDGPVTISMDSKAKE